ncbi:MAG: histidine kinase N-terminal 7TM domain-containing protein, partial [Patescibacteria group bacterium]
MLISLFSIPPFIAAVLFLYLGLFVFLKNPKSSLHIAFFCACLSSFTWEFTYAIAFNVDDYDTALKLMKIGYIGVILIPVTIYQFFYLLFETKRKTDTILLRLSYLLAAFFLFSLFATDNVIASLYTYFWGFYPKAGSIQPLLVGLFLVVSYRVVYNNLVDLLFHSKDLDKEKRK